MALAGGESKYLVLDCMLVAASDGREYVQSLSHICGLQPAVLQFRLNRGLKGRTGIGYFLPLNEMMKKLQGGRKEDVLKRV